LPGAFYCETIKIVEQSETIFLAQLCMRQGGRTARICLHISFLLQSNKKTPGQRKTAQAKTWENAQKEHLSPSFTILRLPQIHVSALQGRSSGSSINQRRLPMDKTTVTQIPRVSCYSGGTARAFHPTSLFSLQTMLQGTLQRFVFHLPVSPGLKQEYNFPFILSIYSLPLLWGLGRFPFHSHSLI